MTADFKYDVFLSHSSKDKPAVLELAERLKDDGLRVWLDDWIIQPGDSIPLAIERGLESSRTLILVMSKNAFASDWVTLERHTALFRDPTNQQRRFIPLRIDDCDIKDTLKQFFYVDWRERNEAAYTRLLSVFQVAPSIEGNPQRLNDSRQSAESFEPSRDKAGSAESPFAMDLVRVGEHSWYLSNTYAKSAADLQNPIREFLRLLDTCNFKMSRSAARAVESTTVGQLEGHMASIRSMMTAEASDTQRRFIHLGELMWYLTGQIVGDVVSCENVILNFLTKLEECKLPDTRSAAQPLERFRLTYLRSTNLVHRDTWSELASLVNPIRNVLDTETEALRVA